MEVFDTSMETLSEGFAIVGRQQSVGHPPIRNVAMVAGHVAVSSR
jgi:hypothetical protein